MIKFACLHCERPLQVADDQAGAEVQCESCQHIQQVPAPTEPPTESPAAQPVGATPSGDDLPTARPIPPAGARSQPADQATAAPAPSAAPVSTSMQLSMIDVLAVGTTPTKQLFDRIVEQLGKLFVGQDELVIGTLVALFSGGHVLIESVPGLGKTLFVRTMARILGLPFGRIQFTPDLMPSDITGAPIYDMGTQEFKFRPGPVFTQLLLADEINRAPAKTHAALLEIMQEHRVTVDGTSHVLERPFLVLATQNPVESEGTYNLPEAQLDRFMFKLVADYPGQEEELQILRLHSRQEDINERLEDEIEPVTSAQEIRELTASHADVRVDDKLIQYINDIVRKTREWPSFHLGASPRAGIALMQGARTLAAFHGRDYVVPDDVAQIVLPTLRHRVILSAEAEVEGHRADDLLQTLVRSVEVPGVQ